MKNTKEVERSFYVDPSYLKYDQQGTVPDLRNWQIPLGRRFRSLKLWFTLRSLGVKRLRENIRTVNVAHALFSQAERKLFQMCRLAKMFAKFVENDGRFEIAAPVHLGLVCFRLKRSNQLNAKLAKIINEQGEIHLVTTYLRDNFVIRFCVSSSQTTAEDVHFAWKVICRVVDSELTINGNQ